MAHLVYESIGFHCLCFMLGLHPECSLSSLLSCFDLWYLFYVQLSAFTLVAMAPVVRVEPSDTKLLDENPDLLAKVEAVGCLSFIHKFTDSNPEVTSYLLCRWQMLGLRWSTSNSELTSVRLLWLRFCR